MRLALYQPDIPQNAGAMLRLAACLGVAADIIEPCGFVLSDRHFRRAGMDYLDHADLTRHVSWEAFAASHRGRLVLLTTTGDTRYTDLRYSGGDTLLVGRETAGVPAAIHRAAAARVVVPLRPDLRSLNVALAAAMVLGEALRQIDGFPKEQQ